MSAAGTDTANLSIRDGIAYVELDKFPMNSLGTGLQYGINDAINIIDDKAKMGEVLGVVLYGAGRTFCAGADFVGGLGKKSDAKKIKLAREKAGMFGFEEIQVPVVAAIHGFALGGGFELALDCHYRVMASKAKLGLPEVNIGFLPGGQGTQRLPRLLATDDALGLMLSGAHIGADQALQMGLVDAVAEGGEAPVEAAAQLCRKVAHDDLNKRRISLLGNAKPSGKGLAVWRKEMTKSRAGELAPQLIIDCVEAALSGTFANGVSFERKMFSDPGGVQDPKVSQFKELQHMFSAERAGGKIPGNKAKPQAINSVGIVGAGLMGGGIAMCCAQVGMQVVLLEMDQQGLDRGMGLIQSNYSRSVKRGSRSQKAVDAALANITGTTEYAAFADCDIVVEAVFEDMEIKKKIFLELDRVTKPTALLCSNTSALDIDEIAAVTKRPELVMGVHFFSPANVMQLLENVRGKHSSDQTIATCMKWGKTIGKWPILVGNCQGFVGNRLLSKYSEMARVVLAQGALPADVDAAIEGFGNKMGPFRMSDMVGLDLGVGALKKAGMFDPQKHMQHALVEAGRLGQKNKSGFYDYADGRTATPSQEANAVIAGVQKAIGLPQQQFSAEQLVHQLFFPLINEGFKVLEEGFATRPADIDVCYVHGYGFPRYRGGPMYYADKVGLPLVRDTLVEMGVQPSALLETCVAQGKSLAKYWPEFSRGQNSSKL